MLTKEELKDKYLLYSEDITEEIFNRVIKRLQELGFKEWKHASNRFTFENFKNVSKLFICKDGDYFITEYTDRLAILVGDIIGEEFVLPEIWWIRVTDENKEILSKWYGNNCLTTEHLVGMCKNERNRITKGYNSLDKPKGGTDEYTYDFGNEITFEQFKEHVLKQKPMQEKISIEKLKQDDEYVVYLDSVEEFEELNKLCKFRVVSKYYGRYCYSPCNWSYSSTSSSTNPGNYIYEKQPSKIITLKDIKEYNMEETQKIIGYECPIDLFQGDIKKGTLYKPTSSTKIVCYAAIGSVGVLGSKYNLPSEIVETWKPVYEDIISMGGYEVKFSKDKIKFDGTEFTKNQLETLEEVLSDNKNIQVTLKHIKADTELLRKLIKNCK